MGTVLLACVGEGCIVEKLIVTLQYEATY